MESGRQTLKHFFNVKVTETADLSFNGKSYIPFGKQVKTIFFLLLLIQGSFLKEGELDLMYLLYPETAYMNCTSFTQAADVNIKSGDTIAPPQIQLSYGCSDCSAFVRYTLGTDSENVLSISFDFDDKFDFRCNLHNDYR